MPARWSLLLATALAGVALVGATPVPTPVLVQPGLADTDGTVAWSPALQVVAGEAGDVVAVDLALDDGTAHAVAAELTVRAVEVDPVEGPSPGAPSDLLALAARRIELQPGDRGVLRATATVPVEPTLVAVEARLLDDVATAAPLALVLVGPQRTAEVGAGITVDGRTATIELANGAAHPTVVDVGVTTGGWLARRTAVDVPAVVVAGDGTRQLELDLPIAVGPRTIEVAVRQRTADGAVEDAPTARVRSTEWPARTRLWVTAFLLVIAVGGATLIAWRRS